MSGTVVPSYSLAYATPNATSGSLRSTRQHGGVRLGNDDFGVRREEELFAHRRLDRDLYLVHVVLVTGVEGLDSAVLNARCCRTKSRSRSWSDQSSRQCGDGDIDRRVLMPPMGHPHGWAKEYV